MTPAPPSADDFLKSVLIAEPTPVASVWETSTPMFATVDGPYSVQNLYQVPPLFKQTYGERVLRHILSSFHNTPVRAAFNLTMPKNILGNSLLQDHWLNARLRRLELYVHWLKVSQSFQQMNKQYVLSACLDVLAFLPDVYFRSKYPTTYQQATLNELTCLPAQWAPSTLYDVEDLFRGVVRYRRSIEWFIHPPYLDDNWLKDSNKAPY